MNYVRMKKVILLILVSMTGSALPIASPPPLSYLEFVPEPYRNVVLNVAQETGVPIPIIAAVALVESNWRPRAIGRNSNGTHDSGLMQINSQYQDYYVELFWQGSEEFDPFDPVHSLYMGAQILSWLYRLTSDWRKAVLAYNVGLSASRHRDTSPYLEKVKGHLQRWGYMVLY